MEQIAHYFDGLDMGMLVLGVWFILSSSVMAGIWKKKVNNAENWFDTLPNGTLLTIIFHVGLIMVIVICLKMLYRYT